MKQLDLFNAPYTYHGYLEPWLPALDNLRAQGLTKRQAAQKLLATNETLREFMERKRYYSWSDDAQLIASLLYAIDQRRRTYMNPGAAFPDRLYGQACDEHAWLLRAEGLTYREIGYCLGVTPTRARQRVMKFGRHLARAMKRTKVSTEERT